MHPKIQQKGYPQTIMLHLELFLKSFLHFFFPLTTLPLSLFKECRKKKQLSMVDVSWCGGDVKICANGTRWSSNQLIPVIRSILIVSSKTPHASVRIKTHIQRFTRRGNYDVLPQHIYLSASLLRYPCFALHENISLDTFTGIPIYSARL